MTKGDISLPRALRSFVGRQVQRDQDRRRMRNLLLEGAASAPTDVADSAYFAELRQRVREVGRE